MINFNGTTLTEVIYNGTNLDSVWFCDRTAGTCTEVFSKPRVYIKTLINTPSCQWNYSTGPERVDTSFSDRCGTPFATFGWTPAPFQAPVVFNLIDANCVIFGNYSFNYCSNTEFTITPAITGGSTSVSVGGYTAASTFPSASSSTTVCPISSTFPVQSVESVGNANVAYFNTHATNCFITYCNYNFGDSFYACTSTVCACYDSVNITACGVTCTVSLDDLANGVTLYFSNN